MEDDRGITHFMRTLLEEYKQLRGKQKDSAGRPFWDLVVITTADAAQKEAFQLQIDEKFQRNELPIDLPICIVPDPPGVRIGNGGSTLTALEFIENIYKDEIYNKRILMIHAGGWSQRMPSATILGKIFSLLPYGNPPYQMLDLKLALYWPFVEKIEPGVFLVCADDFLVYSFISRTDWKIPAKGFTALAHPSPIEIGRTHGVYVIKDISDMNPNDPVVINECLEVLQKPTDEKMKSHGALLKEDVHDFADGIHIEGDVVYTDSSFYFGTDIMQKLLEFKKSCGNLSCEIDAYGDFLQAVGKFATNGYIHQTSNISQMTSNLLTVRQGVFDCLNGSDIHVLVLNASVFIHIGTVKELLYHYCQDRVFQNEMAFEKDVFNAWGLPKVVDTSLLAAHKAERNSDRISPNACIMHSFINQESAIKSDCVIDYCDFELPVQIQEKCILSNCQVTLSEISAYHHKLFIPQNTFVHTVPIFVENQTKFVTIFFSINDDLKKSVSSQDVESLDFLNSNLSHFMEVQGLRKEDILPFNSNNQFEGDHSQRPQILKNERVSLWSLKLYPARTSMTESFEDAICAVSQLPRNRSSEASASLYSLADLLALKDVQAMLNFRKNLFEKIAS